MRKYNKMLINRSNKIIKVNKNKNYNDFSQEMGGYGVNEYYENKETFFKFYYDGKFKRYLIWTDYLKSNLKLDSRTLSIGSGNAVNELNLISSNFNITCSDLEIPQCYEASKKLFGQFTYLKLNILEHSVEEKFDNIYCLSVLYIFSDKDFEKFFINVNKMLESNGTLILEHGACEDNLLDFFFEEIYLVIESYFVYYLSKLFNKKIGFKIDNNFGYKRKNKEIIEFAEKFGFEFISLNEYDYLSELERSVLIRKTIKYLPFTKKFFALLGKNISYIRLFKFKKI